MKNRIYLVLLAVLISLSCNKDETVIGSDPTNSGGTTTISIAITSPVVGEALKVGDSKVIKWTSNTTSKLKIELSTNGGTNWSILADSVTNNGSYIWKTIPESPSDSCLIKITDKSNTNITDIVDYYFKIVPNIPKSISVIKPNGSESLVAGKSYRIQWSKLNVANVKLEYTTNGGINWFVIASSTSADSLGYTWNPLPDVVSAQCKIKITDAAADTVTDMSDANFNIITTQSITILTPTYNETLYIGGNYEIKWIASDIQFVKIEYSVDNGINWKTLISSTANDSSYIWYNIPNTAAAECKLRLSDALDGSPLAESPSTFIIAKKPSLSLLKPDGGDTLSAGNSTTISWESASSNRVPNIYTAPTSKKIKKITNDISKKENSTTITAIKIHYSTDSGNTWLTISTNAPNSGSYVWNPIPNTVSNTCRVKISDAATGTPSDSSSFDFIITAPVAKTLAIKSPLGNETWEFGTIQNITWTSTGIANVKIEYSTDGGTTYTTITSSYTASAGTYPWTVPNISSGVCKIRISDAANTAMSSSNPSSFTISPLQTINVTKPHEGETITAGGTYDIQWTSENIRMVKIEYSTNNGFSWITITDSTESNGFYAWHPVPYISSTNCRIKVSDAKDAIPSNLNDKVFTILTQPTLKVVSPNGGENIFTGSSSKITWTTNTQTSAPRIKNARSINDAPAVQNVKIELTTDGGATWATIVNTISNTGSYDWNSVPNINSTQCKVKVSDALTGIPNDISDSNFVIYNQAFKSISITSPVGTESWASGSNQIITWTSTGIDTVKIEFTTDNGVHWSTIINKIKSTGFYSWSPVPSVTSTNCKIRISDIANGAFSESKNVFTISPEPDIVIVAPNTKVVWVTGSDQSISWVSTNLAKVKLEFTSNNGASWNTISDSTPSIGSYFWTIPNINSSLCKIRVSDPVDGTPSDISDSCFVISNLVQKDLKVTSPNGGEKWQSSSIQNITWSSSAISKVKIEYSTNNGLNWTTLADTVASSGLYQWNPIPQISSTSCKIRISDAVSGTPSDESDATFTINPIKSITVLYPNGSEVWTGGVADTIRWASSGVSYVNIEYTYQGIPEKIAPNGWATIVLGSPNSGFYAWSPTAGASGYKIKISDFETGNPVDESDGTFVVQPQVQYQVKVLKPNGGETVFAGTQDVIQWASLGIEKVDIDYSANGGATWNSVVKNILTSGQYVWSIPNVVSEQCRIKVKDAVTGVLFDISDTNFTIIQSKQLRVTFPNLATDYIIKDTVFTWNSAGIANVNLDLSLDNGVSWTSLAVNTPSTGAYPFVIGANLSALARFRVTDASDPTIYDINDAPFNIGHATTGDRIININKNVPGATTAEIEFEVSEFTKEAVLEFSTDAGKTWRIIEKLNAIDKGTHKTKWNEVPQNVRTLVRIRNGSSKISSVPIEMK